MPFRPGIAIDLGTVNTLVHMAGRGLVLEEPSVVAIERATGKMAAAGTAARDLSGKEPEGIEVLWPLRDGVVADFHAATVMLNAFLDRAHVHRVLTRPSAVICVPRGATSVERRAVEAAVEERSTHFAVRLVDEPIAASLGAEEGLTSGAGTFVVDVGGGTTEVAVIAGGGIVVGRSLRVGGNAMDDAICRAVRTSFGLAIGHRASEALKIALGLTGSRIAAEVVGIDLAREELRSARIPGELVASALERPVRAIVETVHQVLSGVPPDLAADVVNGKIHMAGGGALLLGLADRIGAATGIGTTVVDDPLRCVVRGAARLLQYGEGVASSKAA